jgi:hypothetical protein
MNEFLTGHFLVVCIFSRVAAVKVISIREGVRATSSLAQRGVEVRLNALAKSFASTKSHVILI